MVCVYVVPIAGRVKLGCLQDMAQLAELCEEKLMEDIHCVALHGRSYVMVGTSRYEILFPVVIYG